VERTALGVSGFWIFDFGLEGGAGRAFSDRKSKITNRKWKCAGATLGRNLPVRKKREGRPASLALLATRNGPRPILTYEQRPRATPPAKVCLYSRGFSLGPSFLS
jgi:hypothetical protein